MKKVAILTGAGGCIGQAASKLFSENDYTCVIVDVDKINAEKTIAGLDKKNPHTYIISDISKPAGIDSLVNRVIKEFKQIDVLVNLAASNRKSFNINDNIEERWDKTIDNDLKSVYLLSERVIVEMQKKGGGSIVNIGSIAGKNAYINGNVYCATKFAVDALTQGMRADLLEHEIKVSQISPGAVETEFSIVRFKGDKERADNVYKGIAPLSATDVAEAVVFCATRPANVNINEIILTPIQQASSTQVFRK
ncbi:MAG: SDR family NAD(P)-dependent oxidoreductase, partial [Desulfobulbaceae bacterium]|nr:SDR family NAD(P)-dependent oxidoreductase [Desulfobulbaceae bacterium]